MKILVFSDSHGDTTTMQSALKKHRSAEVVLFCGDGCRDVNTVCSGYPDKAVFSVCGNNDWYCNAPNFLTVELAGKKIFMTHGHLFGVKQGYERIINLGRENGSHIVIFGHTHKQLTTVESGMLLLNPGSVGYGGNYTIIEIDEKTGKIRAVEYPNDRFGPVIL